MSESVRVEGRPHVHVIRYVSPIKQRAMYAIWCDGEPVLWANNYLRSLGNLDENSLCTVAHNLLAWTRFLADQDALQVFMLLSVRGVAGDMQRHFRDALQRRVNADEITWHTADAYLETAYRCCRWWRQPGEPEFGDVRRRAKRGRLNHLTRATAARPSDWRLARNADAGSPEKMLSRTAVDAVWRFLRDDCEPTMPAILRAKPRADWTEARRRAYAEARDSYDYQRGLYRRNLAIWGSLYATGARLHELPMLTVDDVLTYNGNDRKLLLRFVVRPETRRYGRLKGGSAGNVYLGHVPEAVDAVVAWQAQRGATIARGQRRGVADHRQLFTNDDGSPLTAGAIIALMRRIRAEVDRRFPPDADAQHVAASGTRRRCVRSSVYAHLLRHTIETVMRSGGVSGDIQSRHLRQRDPKSKDAYGSVYDDVMVTALDAMAARNARRRGEEG